jgi:hypothetical protein
MSKSYNKFKNNDNGSARRNFNGQRLDFESGIVRLEKNGGRKSRKFDPRGKNRKEYYDNDIW